MDYNDVKGQLSRYWKMVETPDPRVGLAEGDFLVFEGNAPGAIKKITPKTRGGLRNSPSTWGTSFTSTTPLSDYAIKGALASDPDVKIRVEFTAANGTAGALLKFSAEFPGDIQPITWQAEEGP